MIVAHTETIYYVEPDFSQPIDERPNVMACTTKRLLTIDEADMPSLGSIPKVIPAEGLESGDLAVFVSYLDDKNHTFPVSYLVSMALGGSNLLVPSDLVEAHPRMFTTPYMRYMIGELAPDEFEQFTMPRLTAFVRGAEPSPQL